MYIHCTDRVNQTGSKTPGNRLLNALDASIIRPFAANPIVGFAGGAVQAEAEKVHFLRADLKKDVIKKVTVGVNGDRTKTLMTGIFNGSRQIRMQCRFTAQEYDICCGEIMEKRLQPSFDGF